MSLNKLIYENITINPWYIIYKLLVDEKNISSDKFNY